MTRKAILLALAGALALQGCSSRPRQFTPDLAAVPVDRGRFEVDYATCRQLLADGQLTSSGRLASGAAGAAAGATALAVGGTVAGSAGFYGGLAVAGATVVALPFVAVAGAWGLAKSKKKKKEKAIQTAIAGCLADRGYEVAGWTRSTERASKLEAGAATE